MRRHDFLLTPGQETARKERRRGRYGVLYPVEGEPAHACNMMFLCLVHHGIFAAHENRDHYSCNRTPDPSSEKLVYLEAMKARLRDKLQSTWGRIQQKEEMEYEPFVEMLVALKRLRSRRIHSRLTGEGRKVLEEFEGFVDQFDDTVAHVTLKTQSGETFYGEYPAAELKAVGIHERRRFKCWTVETGPSVEFVIEPIPDRELSEDRERQIDEWLQKTLGDDDVPQDDY